MNYNTGVGSRHTVQLPTGKLWLHDYEIQFLWDDSRNSQMATVLLVHYSPQGSATESIVVYNTDDAYTALFRALKDSTKPWAIQRWKLRLRYRLAKVHDLECSCGRKILW